MAWTEQCKVAFCNTAENLYIKNGNKGIVKIIKKISKESGIPFGTLRDWYYTEKKIPDSRNPPDANSTERPTCPMCEIRNRERKRDSKGEWYYYDFCWKCRKGEEEVELTCPHCGEPINIKKREVCS